MVKAKKRKIRARSAVSKSETADPKLLKELSEQLRIFQASQRFDFVRQLNVQKLLADGGSDAVGIESLTLEDMVILGAKEVLRLRGMTAARVRALVQTMRSLAASPGDTPPDPSLAGKVEFHQIAGRTLAAGGGETLHPSGLEVMTTIEAEQRIGAAIAVLRSSPRFSSISDRMVKHFWREEWPSSPFEEVMTLRQVCELDVERLLRKRSFSGVKVTAFLRALEAAIGEANSDQASVLQPAAGSPQLRLAPSKPVRGECIAWDFSRGSFGPGAVLALRRIEQLIAGGELPNPLAEILQLMHGVLSAEEFYALLAHSEGAAQSGIDHSREIRKLQRAFASLPADDGQGTRASAAIAQLQSGLSLSLSEACRLLAGDESGDDELRGLVRMVQACCELARSAGKGG